MRRVARVLERSGSSSARWRDALAALGFRPRRGRGPRARGERWRLRVGDGAASLSRPRGDRGCWTLRMELYVVPGADTEVGLLRALHAAQRELPEVHLALAEAFDFVTVSAVLPPEPDAIFEASSAQAAEALRRARFSLQPHFQYALWDPFGPSELSPESFANTPPRSGLQSRSESMPLQEAKASLWEQWMEHLREEGFRPRIEGPDGDGDVSIDFKLEGVSVRITLEASDPHYVGMNVLFVAPKNVERARILEAINEVSLRAKIGKGGLEADNERLFFYVEFPLEDPGRFAAVFERATSALQCSREVFYRHLEGK